MNPGVVIIICCLQALLVQMYRTHPIAHTSGSLAIAFSLLSSRTAGDTISSCSCMVGTFAVLMVKAVCRCLVRLKERTSQRPIDPKYASLE